MGGTKKQNKTKNTKNSDHKGSHQAFTGATLELKTKLLDKKNANYASTLIGKKWRGKLINLGPCSQKINQVRQFLPYSPHSTHFIICSRWFLLLLRCKQWNRDTTVLHTHTQSIHTLGKIQRKYFFQGRQDQMKIQRMLCSIPRTREREDGRKLEWCWGWRPWGIQGSPPEYLLTPETSLLVYWNPCREPTAGCQAWLSELSPLCLLLLGNDGTRTSHHPCFHVP